MDMEHDESGLAILILEAYVGPWKTSMLLPF